MCLIIDKSSLIVSETETEEEILFESKKGKSTEKQALITQQNNGTNTVKNNLSDPSGRAKKTMNTSWMKRYICNPCDTFVILVIHNNNRL